MRLPLSNASNDGSSRGEITGKITGSEAIDYKLNDENFWRCRADFAEKLFWSVLGRRR